MKTITITWYESARETDIKVGDIVKSLLSEVNNITLFFELLEIACEETDGVFRSSYETREFQISDKGIEDLYVARRISERNVETATNNLHEAREVYQAAESDLQCEEAEGVLLVARRKLDYVSDQLQSINDLITILK